jgi:hypothetical protein
MLSWGLQKNGAAMHLRKDFQLTSDAFLFCREENDCADLSESEELLTCNLQFKSSVIGRNS